MHTVEVVAAVRIPIARGKPYIGELLDLHVTELTTMCWGSEFGAGIIIERN
jgi:hypothetical protein